MLAASPFFLLLKTQALYFILLYYILAIRNIKFLTLLFNRIKNLNEKSKIIIIKLLKRKQRRKKTVLSLFEVKIKNTAFLLKKKEKSLIKLKK